MVSNWQEIQFIWLFPTLNVQVLRLFMVANQAVLAVAFIHAVGPYKEQMLKLCPTLPELQQTLAAVAVGRVSIKAANVSIKGHV